MVTAPHASSSKGLRKRLVPKLGQSAKSQILHDYKSVGREEDRRPHCCFLLRVPSADNGEKGRRHARFDKTEKEPLRESGELPARR